MSDDESTGQRLRELADEIKKAVAEREQANDRVSRLMAEMVEVQRAYCRRQAP